MAEIEFIGVPAAAPPRGTAGRRRLRALRFPGSWRRFRPAAVPAALWAVAAGLLIGAPFARVYSNVTTIDDQHERYAADGWGRMTGSDLGGAADLRLGVLFCLAAVLAVFACCIALAAPELRALVGGLGLLAVGMVATLGVFLQLEIADLRHNGNLDYEASSRVTLGNCFWFTLAAFLVALLALAVGAITLRPRPPRPPRREPPPPAPFPPTPGYEELPA